ncbi:hypothetical protein GCM10007972_17710 [Iodidimonas muriae]|uniref:histidine kinase n=2 Tax=Iodidimonas muriae TaxID=261467 RepID=A0ABQ2LDR5_9PROT|nr:hypothetical protein GCM10007972_17710 [Iodidimonas muriae]
MLGLRDGNPGLFDAVFEECEAGLLILDLDLARLDVRISDVNPALCSWLGRSRQSLCGMQLFTLLSDQTRQGDIVRLHRAMARHSPVCVDVMLRPFDDGMSPIPVTMTVRPVGMAGRAPRMVAVLRHQEGELHQALIQAQRDRDAALQARERMLARISHDLRTPLNGILGFSQIMAGIGREPDAPTLNYADDIVTLGRELLTRIEDLLAVAEDRVSTVPRTLQDVDLGAFVESSLDGFRERFTRAGLTLSRRIEAALPKLRAVSADILGLLSALMENALLCAPRHSRVVFSVFLDEAGRLTLHMSDLGPSLSLDEINAAAAAFDEETDVYASPHRRKTAGLPMAKVLAERNGGIMSVSGKEGGEGFSCCIHFPVHHLCFQN